MVRTKHVGHIRDVRRLIVAMSRARLGLYVFGRQSLFVTCTELKSTFSQLFARSVNLQIIPFERYPSDRNLSDYPSPTTEIGDVNQLIEINKQLAIQSNNIPRR